jgi:acetyl-CoA carboxylase beta subunit
VDMVVHRLDLKDRLARILDFLEGGKRDGRA